MLSTEECVNENVRGQRPGKPPHLRDKQWKKREPRKEGEMIWQKEKILWPQKPKDDKVSTVSDLEFQV